jgi:hypothetical protein
MDEETKGRLEAIEKSLKALEDANGAQAKLNAQLEQIRSQIKTDLLAGATTEPGVIRGRLTLIPGGNKSSTKPEDYQLTFESKTGSATDEQWKLEVNDRYQKAVGTVISLSTAAVGAPFVFLKDIHGNQAIRHVLTCPAYLGWSLLAISIVSAVVYYFFSAKWVKLALVNDADFFWIPLGKGFVEVVLDISYFLMMAGFLAGVYFMVQFMLTYVPQ